MATALFYSTINNLEKKLFFGIMVPNSRSFYVTWSFVKFSKKYGCNLGSKGFSSLQENISFQTTTFHYNITVYKQGLLSVTPATFKKASST